MNDLTVRKLVYDWVHFDATSNPVVPDADSVTARGNFLGEETSDPKAKGTEIYTDPQNLPTAIASILNHTQNRANFHPASTSPDHLEAKFRQYIAEIDKTPFLHLETDSTNKQTFNTKDYNLLVDQVVNLYTGVNAKDLNLIKQSITDMAKSVFGQKKSESWQNLFSQSTIDLSNPRNPKIRIFYTSLHMKHSKSGKSDVSQQEYEVHATEYLVLPDLIQSNAETLANLDKKSVDEWINSATSPERENAQLCFEIKPFSDPLLVSK